MTMLQKSKVADCVSYQTPAGQILAGEVIARFLSRLSRHRRVMRIAGRVQCRRAGEQE